MEVPAHTHQEIVFLNYFILYIHNQQLICNILFEEKMNP